MIKNIKHILITLFMLPMALMAQEIEQDLRVADSLFEAKKYTESFEIYKAILETAETYSPSMLLKMAFIKEGLNDATNALYYLDLYHQSTNDEVVLKKMEELAEVNGLSGYTRTDGTYALNFFQQYDEYIIYGLAALAVILFVSLIYQRFKKSIKPVVTAVFLVLTLALISVFINFQIGPKKAIVNRSQAYVMKGPSVGSDVLEIIQAGNRVEIVGSKDIWYRIRWDSKSGYIRSSDLKRSLF